MRVNATWRARSTALWCVLAMGCGSPAEDTVVDAGDDAGQVEEDTGACASGEWFDEAAMGCASCAADVSCALYDVSGSELSFEKNQLTIALNELPYPVEELTLKGEQILYICTGCSDTDCPDTPSCSPLETVEYETIVNVVDGVFAFAFLIDDPDYNGVKLTSFEWTDPCGVVQQLSFVGEWDYVRSNIKTPIRCTEE